jgi:hypothetical protein
MSDFRNTSKGTSMSREAMKQALEALEEINKLSVGEHAICLPAEIDTAINALRQELAMSKPSTKIFGPNLEEILNSAGFYRKREWVGLTMNEAKEFYEKYTDRAELINALDKFLEEKNT